MFNYDWFHGQAYEDQKKEASNRCLAGHFPDLQPEDYKTNGDAKLFRSELEIRTLIYLRDGVSYEIKDIADVPSRSHLVFECEPVDENYKACAFVITLPFEEIARVEVCAVHPSEKPDDLPQITGFRSHLEPPIEHKPGIEPKPSKPNR